MATAPYQTSPRQRTKSFIERWFFTIMAILMLTVSTAGFMPSIVHPDVRRAPLSMLAAVHGIVFFAWLLLFFAQSLLVATGQIRWHRRLGLTSVVLLAVMVPLAFQTTAAMVRRGFDLSGDQHIDPHPRGPASLDAYQGSIFNFGDLLFFTILAAAAILYRSRAEIHKRLILFANIALMGAPIVHLIGHTPRLAAIMTPAIVLIPVTTFLLATLARDYLVERRIHPLTACLAAGYFASYPIRGAIIGPSPAWHHFANWLSR